MTRVTNERRKTLAQLLGKLCTPFISLDTIVPALKRLSVGTRVIYRYTGKARPDLFLELRVEGDVSFVAFGPSGMAYIHEFGWSPDVRNQPFAPAIGSEDLIDGLLAVFKKAPLDARVWCTNEWTVRARASAALAALTAG